MLDASGLVTSSMSDRAFVDTNVVVYAFDDDEPVKQEQARSIIDPTNDDVLVVSTQVLSEFYVTVTRKLARPLPPDVAARAVNELLQLPIVSVDPTLVVRAMQTSDRHRISLWDAQIIEAAAAAGCTRLLTEDLAGGSTIRGVAIIDPFS